MTDRDQQLTELFNRPAIKDIIKRATPEKYFQDELRSILFESLSRLSDERLNSEYQNGIEKYIGAIIKLQFKSETSTFHKVIRRPRLISIQIDDYSQHELNNVPDELDNRVELIESAQSEFKKLCWFDRQIFGYVIEEMTVKQIAQLTGINRTYLSGMITRIRKELKSNVRSNL